MKALSKSLKQLILVSIFLAMLSVQVGAVGIEYYGIEDTIRNDMTIENTILLKFDSPINHLDYQLAYKVENLTAKATFDNIKCEIITLEIGSVISCDFIGMTKEKNQVELKFETDKGIEKIGKEYKFTINYGINLPIKRVFALIKLPENSVFSREVANMSFYPRDGTLLTDGKHIMVAWERENLTSGDDLQFMVLYTKPSFGSDIQNVLIILITIIVLATMIGIAIYLKRGRERPKEKTISALIGDEKTIIKILEERGGKAYQKLLVRKSNFSKAKVSRLVKSLKERGVVDIVPISGRENEIILKRSQVEADKL